MPLFIPFMRISQAYFGQEQILAALTNLTGIRQLLHLTKTCGLARLYQIFLKIVREIFGGNPCKRLIHA